MVNAYVLEHQACSFVLPFVFQHKAYRMAYDNAGDAQCVLISRSIYFIHELNIQRL